MAESHSGLESQRVRSKKFMIFVLGVERFAIPLSQVKEVIGLTQITPVPDVPSYFKGLINLRGRIISVIDLRQKISISLQKSESKRPCIIISELENMILGSIVDDVVEVVGIEAEKIEKNLEIVSSSNRNYVTGAARFSQGPLTLMLDMGKLLNVEELLQLKNQTTSKEEASSLKSA